MSAAPSQPEFFFDRSLGKVSARLLRAHGWTVHLITEHYPHDARSIEDQDWIAEGCSRGWALLTKDKKIRYRESELGSLGITCHLFCLQNGNLPTEQMASHFDLARSRIERVITVSQAVSGTSMAVAGSSACGPNVSRPASPAGTPQAPPRDVDAEPER